MDEPLDGRLFGEGQPCFGCAPDHPIGFRLTFDRVEKGVRTRFVPDDRYQGPPGIMHGGLVMTLADEVAAWAIVSELGKFGFTAHADLTFKKPVRTGKELEAEARLARASARVVSLDVVIRQGETTCAEGQYKFALLDRAAAERVLEGPLPAAWERFARE